MRRTPALREGRRGLVVIEATVGLVITDREDLDGGLLTVILCRDRAKGQISVQLLLMSLEMFLRCWQPRPFLSSSYG
ncbi:hypothetical protein LENED_005437 [Lentinula edodes]|uniref:Uncharacterized protein n=1 Tax=Lentinula edodes TaxID=5353 RepID=A0A1Q3E8X9_LENED|nr:hypothetical protein LENED_005437 [Lentinula edodes]